MANSLHNELFASLISDIKTYTGKDPLLPWLRGIRIMRQCLPPQLLKVKLPRFLQKCTESFIDDRRYKNDLRFLRVWIQLMDFVDDPRVVLRIMEMNRIGIKRSLFYQAYALHYEKIKKFDDAWKMYSLGMQNDSLAEPKDELKKSYEQFLNRMERHKNKRIKRHEGRAANKFPSAMSIHLHCGDNKESKDSQNQSGWTNKCLGESSSQIGLGRSYSNHIAIPSNSSTEKETGEANKFLNQLKERGRTEIGLDETTVVKFVGNAIVENSEAEDACHHGLVEPTMNTKEAMNAINSMFREPLEPAFARKKSNKSQLKPNNRMNNGFAIFKDENFDSRGSSHCEEPFKIFVDGEDTKDETDQLKARIEKAFVFPCPEDLRSSDSSGDPEKLDSSPQEKFREDTVVCRFVGSTISDEPEVENVCHHGLVDPTINLKEAMEDINMMFGKPIDFVRKKRVKKQGKTPDKKRENAGFLILPDDEVENERMPPQQCPSGGLAESNLFEPTVFTKEAIDEINKMFGMPLDF